MGTRILVAIMTVLLLAGCGYGDVVYSTLRPSSNDAYDLGTSAKQWQDLYLSGTLYFDGVATSSFIQGLMNDTTQLAAQTTLGVAGLWRSAVNMVYTGSQDWTVYEPNGAMINISASTTDGLQEALNYCSTNNYGLYIWGSDVMNCTTTVTFPARQNDMDVYWLGGGVINFPAGIGANTGIIFDSSYDSTVYLDCIVAYAGTGVAVDFKPTNPVPTDAITSIWGSKFWIKEVFANTGDCVRFNTTTAGIANGNTFDFGIIDAGGGGQAIIQTGASGVSHNRIQCYFIKTTGSPAASPAVELGTAFGGNDWFLSMDVNNTQVGVSTQATTDNYYLNIIRSGGGTDGGILCGTGAIGNRFFMRKFQSGTFTDNSTAENNLLLYKNRFYGNLQLMDNLLIPDAGTIGSVSDTDAIQIEADGDVVITQDLVIPTGTISAYNLTTAIVDINNAEIKALTTAKELVAAPGSGKLLEFVSAVLILDYSGGALAEPSAPDDLAIEYDNGTGTQIATWDTTGFITSTADAMHIVNAASVAGGAAPVLTATNVNKNIALINLSTNYTGAGSTSEIRVIVTYRVHTSLGL